MSKFNVINKFNTTLLTPVRAIRPRYIPLLMIYFAYGASSFSGIAESFFVKEHLSLSASAIMMIGVWLTIPWTVKMVFGQLVDSLPLFKSSRRSYIFIAAGLMALGSLMMAGLAGKWSWVTGLGSANSIYIFASLITVIGVVLQDVVADTMSVEVVHRTGRNEEDIKRDLAMVQLLGRISLSFAMFLVAGLGGWLAQHYSYETIFLLTLIIPAISVTGILIIKIEQEVIKPLNWTILGGGLLFAFFIIGIEFYDHPPHHEVLIAISLMVPILAIVIYKFQDSFFKEPAKGMLFVCLAVVVIGLAQIQHDQEIIFLVSLALVIFFLRKVTHDLPKEHLKKIACAAAVIFIFRAMPPVGPGLQWWQIDVLGFNKAFFGTLAQIGTGLTIVGMWVFAKYITEKPIGKIFVILTIISFILGLPIIGMYYGLHEWTQRVFGFGAHTIALVDTAIASPFAQLSMIPMLTLTAIYAPKGNTATWFALMASLMNLALQAGNIISKQLNHIWVVTREVKVDGIVTVHANYSHLGTLLIICSLAGLILPIAAVMIFLPGDLKAKNKLTVGR